MTKLILIRHGETDHNKNSIYCGMSDPPLNKSGIKQTEKLKKRLVDLKINKIYTSCLTRAIQTANIVFGDPELEQISDFNEIDFGAFEGLRYDQIIERHGKEYSNWINDPVNTIIPDGETLASLYKRVEQGLSRVLSRAINTTIAIVSHGGPIRVILCQALCQNIDSFWSMTQDNCALNIIEYKDGSPPNVLAINDVSHL